MTPRMFYTLARVLAALTVIPFHEAGHALAAWLLGDPTAKQQGRLSLNPFRHFDLLGTLCMVFAGVGWAKPVSTDPRTLKRTDGAGRARTAAVPGRYDLRYARKADLRRARARKAAAVPR